MKPDDGMPTNDPEKRRVVPNAVLAAMQVVVGSVTLFFLYRFLLSAVGVEALGVWSLVVAATSLASVSNLGLAGGTVRFVSKYLAREDSSRAASAAETATLSTALVMGIAALVLWPVSNWLVGLIVPSAWTDQARQLLPFTLVSLWLNSVGGAVYSGLDGCHRAGIRSVATMVTQPIILFLGLWLVPLMGLKGLAIAQLVQYSTWLVLGWILLQKRLPSLSLIPRRWSRPMFLEMWRYGLNFQLISILTILTDPLAKALLSHFGGLSAVGYFEMANRLVSQARALLVSANQVLVPYYSKVTETSREMVEGLYKKNLNAVIVLANLVFSSLVALLPLVSVLWIGRLEPQFLLFATVLAAGWFVSTLSAPAFFANLGGGWIKRNVLGQLAQTLAMVVFGVVGGILGGATGSVVAYFLALASGSLVILGTFHRSERIAVSTLLSKANLTSLGLGAGLAVGGFLSYVLLSGPAGRLSATGVTILVLLAGWAAFWFLIPELSSLARTTGNLVRSRRPTKN